MRSGALVGGRYTLHERLGAGGAGEVWRASDRERGAEVAVKLLHDARPEQIARLAREARVLARLAHPRIVRAIDFDGDHEPPYLVMDLIRGGTLAERRPLPLPPAEVREILDAILEALAAAHDAGIVHRDLTPANVMLDPERGPVVTDFGLARGGLEPRVTASGILVGTPEYWAPEHGRGGPPTPAGDLYAAGTIAFELLTGRLPFPADDGDRLGAASRRLVDDPPPVEAVAPEAAAADPRLAALILDLLAREPVLRPTASMARRWLAGGRGIRRQLAGLIGRR